MLALFSSTCDGLLGTQVAQEKVERQGLGVSKEGQQIFDCIYKTLPCKWQEKTIIVLNEVSLHDSARIFVCMHGAIGKAHRYLLSTYPSAICFFMLQVHVKEPYDTSSVTKAHSDVPSTTLERVILMVRHEDLYAGGKVSPFACAWAWEGKKRL